MSISLILISLCALSQQAGVIAEVNGEVITRRDIELRLQSDPRYTRLKQSFQGEVLRRKALQLEKQYLEFLIDELIVRQLIRKKNITLDAADQPDVERMHRQSVAKFESEAAYRQALSREGLTEEDDLNRIRLQLQVEKLRRQEIGPEEFVTPKGIRDFYEEMAREADTANFLDGERARFFVKGSLGVRQIKFLGDSRGPAQKVLEEALAGADFAELARTHSDGPRKEHGGLWTFEGSAASFTAKRAEAIGKMQPGEISPLIAERGAYYILKLETRVPSRLRKFDDVQKDIRGLIAGRARRAQLDRWFRELRKKAHIVYHPIEGRGR